MRKAAEVGISADSVAWLIGYDPEVGAASLKERLAALQPK